MTAEIAALYSTAMELELAQLESKVSALAELCLQLRQENNELRQQLTLQQQARQTLNEKMDLAASRVEQLLAQLPEALP